MPAIIPNVHPIFVHFTIALLAVASLLFLVAAVMGPGTAPGTGPGSSPGSGKGRTLRGIETAANWNLWLGVVITALTIAAGLQAAGSVAHDEPAHIAMMDHKFWAFGTAALFAVLALWNILRVRREQRVGLAFLVLLIVGLVGLAGTGLRGADLVFGHGLGVRSLPQAEGHSHDAGGKGEVAEHSHDAGAKGEEEHSHGPAVAAAPAPVPEVALTPAQAEVVAALTGFHDALTTGDIAAPEKFVVADESFIMIEGKNVNRGWADYRDNHLKGELADLAKVRFRLSGFRVQMDGKVAAVNFLFNLLPKTGPEMDFGSGRETAVLIHTDAGWKLQFLHTS